ncbi:MAG: peptide-methionine (R)-S-oxide reductase [Candidatus Nitrosotenuis sp.]|nr:MAG: peptide-methionine (R)-S-oxide reductase [Candidatus Nitrosotenuis sp.]
MVDEITKSDQEWKQVLSPEEFEVCRKKDTEAPFTGKYTHCKDDGIYRCTCCENELFKSDTKFDSGTGWPSFFEPLRKDSVKYETDTAYGMMRTEVMCAKCGSHLGHVFDDGPKPTFARYCINSVSLKLEKTDSKTSQK